MALITAAQVREHYPQIVGTGEDTLLDTMITRADGLIAAYCGYPAYDGGTVRTLEDQTYTLYLDGPRFTEPQCLDLGIRPVVSVTSAHVDSAWDYGSDAQVATADMVLDARAGLLWLRSDASSSWEDSPRANKVVIVAGFASTPPDLVAAAAMLVRHLLALRHQQGVGTFSAGGQSATRSDADELVPAAVREALAPYVLGGSRVG